MSSKKFIDNFRPEVKAQILGLYIKHSNPYSQDSVRWWNGFDRFLIKNKNHIKNLITNQLYTEFEKLTGSGEYDIMDSILNEIELLKKI